MSEKRIQASSHVQDSVDPRRRQALVHIWSNRISLEGFAGTRRFPLCLLDEEMMNVVDDESKQGEYLSESENESENDTSFTFIPFEEVTRTFLLSRLKPLHNSDARHILADLFHCFLMP